jgi:DNA-binding MarR family transcriptional regulator
VAGERAPIKEPLDPIAEAVRQWDAHEFGALEHMEATTAIMRMQQLIAARIDQELRPFGITFAQYEALVLLHFSQEGELPLGRMGRRLMVHAATVTNTMDQLESQGLAKRQRHQRDRRSVLAQITPRGRRVAVAASEALVDVKFGLHDMSDREARTLAKTIRTFRARIADFV